MVTTNLSAGSSMVWAFLFVVPLPGFSSPNNSWHSWGPCGAAKFFLDLFIPGLDQSLQFLALGQTGVPGQLATTYQLANGVVGGTELQELLAFMLFNQICSNGHWFFLLILDLVAEEDVHHGWLQLAGSLGLASPHPNTYWANACPQKHVAKDVAKRWLLWGVTFLEYCPQNKHLCFDKLLRVHQKGEITFDILQNKNISGETNSQFQRQKSQCFFKVFFSSGKQLYGECKYFGSK